MRCFTFALMFLFSSLTYSAPIPKSKERPNHNNKLVDMTGEWDLEWNDLNAKVTFHPNGTYQWFDISCGVWEGVWEVKEEVLTIKEKRLDEQKDYWYVTHVKLDKELKGVTTGSTEAKVKYTRHKRKVDF